MPGIGLQPSRLPRPRFGQHASKVEVQPFEPGSLSVSHVVRENFVPGPRAIHSSLHDVRHSLHDLTPLRSEKPPGANTERQTKLKPPSSETRLSWRPLSIQVALDPQLCVTAFRQFCHYRCAVTGLYLVVDAPYSTPIAKFLLLRSRFSYFLRSAKQERAAPWRPPN